MNIIKFTLILTVVTPIFGCVVSDTQSHDAIDYPTPKKEYKTPKKDISQKYDWSDLVKKSSVAVVGHVEDIFYVVDEKKLYENKSIVNGIVPLPNLKDGVKGILVRFCIDEIVRSQNGERPGETIGIYIQDGYQVPADSPVPRLLSGKKYLVFLSPLEKRDEFKERTVIQPRDLAKGSSRFAQEKAFVITQERNGYLEITDSNQNLVIEVRQTLKEHK